MPGLAGLVTVRPCPGYPLIVAATPTCSAPISPVTAGLSKNYSTVTAPSFIGWRGDAATPPRTPPPPCRKPCCRPIVARVRYACRDRLRRNGFAVVGLTDDCFPIADRTASIETGIIVRQALMRLSPEQRAAVVAVDMHGYSVADTAKLLGVAEGTVKSRCSRARARLAVMLGNPSTAVCS